MIFMAKEGCGCGINMRDLAMGAPHKDLGFRKVVCVKCDKVFYTVIKDKTMCFDCEKIS